MTSIYFPQFFSLSHHLVFLPHSSKIQASPGPCSYLEALELLPLPGWRLCFLDGLSQESALTSSSLGFFCDSHSREGQISELCYLLSTRPLTLNTCTRYVQASGKCDCELTTRVKTISGRKALRTALRSSLMHSGLRIFSWIPNIGHLGGRVTLQTDKLSFNAPGRLEVSIFKVFSQSSLGPAVLSTEVSVTLQMCGGTRSSSENSALGWAAAITIQMASC